MRYEIHVAAGLDQNWSKWFEGMDTARVSDNRTRLVGHVEDQAALHGVLTQVRDLGLEIISITRDDLDHESQKAQPTNSQSENQGDTMNTNLHETKETLVLGATGKTGRRVVARLRDRGIPVREGSRNGSPGFDWNNQATWAPILDDVGAVYISYYPDLAAPGAPEAVRAFANAAINRGVQKLVLLSGRGEEEAQRAEQVLLDTGADVTIVRCGWFMQNFSEDFMHGAVMDGQLVLPGGEGQEPFVDADDIADVAVAALTEDGHRGEIYELTSPRLYTLADVATELSRATGRTISYVPVTVEEYAAGATEHGVPAELVGFLTYLFGEVFGNNAYVTDGVQRALGRPARDFATFAEAAAATSAWELAPAS